MWRVGKLTGGFLVALLACPIAVLIECVPELVGEQPTPLFPCKVRTMRAEYLLGEPVLLEVIYANMTNQDMRVREHLPHGGEPPLAICVSGEGQTFRRFSYGLPIVCLVGSESQPIKPGGSWRYPFRLFFSRLNGGELAFRDPGIYFVRIAQQVPPSRGQPAHSNIVRFQISAPNGNDRKVWERMQSKQIFDLLQFGTFYVQTVGPKYEFNPPPATRQTVMQVAQLLEEFPTTGYRSAFVWALKKAYHSKRAHLANDELARIRKLTGITDVAEFKDERLEQPIIFDINRERLKVHPDGSMEFPLQALLDMLKRQTGIEFDACEHLKKRTVGIHTNPKLLRDYMGLEFVTDRLEAYWVPRGRGYYLTQGDETEAGEQESRKK